MKKPAEQLELIVVGAGPVGLLFAARLLRQQTASRFHVRIVDAQPPARWHAERTDTRVYALSRASQLLLGDRWSTIASRRSSAYRRMRVWEGSTPFGGASIGFDAADIGEPDLGHIVEDSLLRTALLDELADTNVEIAFGVGVESLAPADGGVAVTMSDGSTVTADLVIGADGASSRVRSAAGIEAIDKRYGQRAIVCHVSSEKFHAETAWQRFLPDGPLALLPLADGRSSVVWTNTEAAAERLLTIEADDFLRELEAASAGVLGRLGPCTERIGFPLRLTHAVRYVGPGVALIGDSAHTVHPLAGQGMNLGLRDAAVLADTLATALAAGEYPGDEHVLRRYERAQKAHNVGMQIAFDGLNELFGRRIPEWAAPIRSLGLAMVDRISPAKRLLMRQALGVDAELRVSLGDHAA